MPKVWFPNVALQVMPNGNHLTTKGVVHLRAPPSQTKVEIKNLLSKVYGVGVIKVNTMNYAGKIKRDRFSMYQYRKNKWKKAVVTVDNSQYLDILNQQELAKAPRSDEPL
jgi:ribosomal protein L23